MLRVKLSEFFVNAFGVQRVSKIEISDSLEHIGVIYGCYFVIEIMQGTSREHPWYVH